MSLIFRFLFNVEPQKVLFDGRLSGLVFADDYIFFIVIDESTHDPRYLKSTNIFKLVSSVVLILNCIS